MQKLRFYPLEILHLRPLVTYNLCYTTVMLTFSNPYAHVANAAFAQARFSFGSGLLTLLREAGLTSPETIKF